jgi:hypothetical protein
MKRVNEKQNRVVNSTNEFKNANENRPFLIKKIRFLFAAMAIVACMSLVSCSSDDDPQPEIPEKIQPLPPEIPQQPLPPNIEPH